MPRNSHLAAQIYETFPTISGQNAILQISEQPRWIIVVTHLQSANMNTDEKHNKKTVIICIVCMLIEYMGKANWNFKNSKVL